MKYILDANVFIQAHRFYYPEDVFPSVWKWIIEKNDENQVFSIDQIYDEIAKGNDDLYKWVSQLNKDAFFLVSTDLSTQLKFTEVADFVQSLNFNQFQKDDFLRCADPWLIATALDKDMILVTQEKYDPNIKRKVLIPNICEEFDVRYIDTIKFFRVLQANF